MARIERSNDGQDIMISDLGLVAALRTKGFTHHCYSWKDKFIRYHFHYSDELDEYIREWEEGRLEGNISEFYYMLSLVMRMKARLIRSKTKEID